MKQRLLTLCILILAVSLASWQPQPSATTQRGQFLGDTIIVRNAPVPLPKGDTASKYIKLLPGFQANPANGQFYVATIDTTKKTNTAADTSCFIRIKALAANSSETNQLPRLNGTLQPLTLSVEDLSPAGFWNTGATYTWTRPSNATANTPTLTASTIGKYKVSITKAGINCNVSVILSSTPCKPRQANYNCNVPNIDSVADVPSQRLTNLAIGDTIRAGDFDVIVRDVSGTSGGWTGLGKVRIPYLSNSQIAVEFTNIIVNNCYELVAGSKIHSSFDPSWSGLIDVSGSGQNILTLGTQITDLLGNYQCGDSTKIVNFLQRLAQYKNVVQQDTGLVATNKQLAIVKLDSVIAALEQVKTQPNTCASCGAPNGRIAQVENAPACIDVRRAILNKAYEIEALTGGGVFECNAPKPNGAGRDGEPRTTNGRRTILGKEYADCEKMWIYVQRIGNILVESGWYESIDVVIDQTFKFGEVYVTDPKYGRGINWNYKIPKLTRPSQWYSTDRDCSCRTFASAAAYNTQNNKPQFYKPIDQIFEYYSWATKEIEKTSPVRFFHAAQDVTSLLGVGGAFYIPVSGSISEGLGGLSEQGRKSLADVNVILLSKNMPVIKDLINTGASSAVQGTGIVWDFNYVFSEQKALSLYLSQAPTPLAQSDITKINDNLAFFEFLHCEFKLAKILAGVSKLNYQTEFHRVTIGRALVFLRHAEKSNFVNSQEYNNAIQYLTTTYGVDKANRFIQMFTSFNVSLCSFPKP